MEEPEKSPASTLASPIDTVEWARFLIMNGCLWLVPPASVPESTQLVGTGMIIFGANLVKRSAGLTMNPFSTGVAVIAVGRGIAGFLDVEFPLFPVLLIVVGPNIIIKLIAER